MPLQLFNSHTSDYLFFVSRVTIEISNVHVSGTG